MALGWQPGQEPILCLVGEIETKDRQPESVSTCRRQVDMTASRHEKSR